MLGDSPHETKSNVISPKTFPCTIPSPIDPGQKKQKQKLTKHLGTKPILFSFLVWHSRGKGGGRKLPELKRERPITEQRRTHTTQRVRKQRYYTRTHAEETHIERQGRNSEKKHKTESEAIKELFYAPLSSQTRCRTVESLTNGPPPREQRRERER